MLIKKSLHIFITLIILCYLKYLTGYPMEIGGRVIVHGIHVVDNANPLIPEFPEENNPHFYLETSIVDGVDSSVVLAYPP